MSSLYNIDYNRWALEQAAALKAGQFQELDLIHLVEEIEDLIIEDSPSLQSYPAEVLGIRLSKSTTQRSGKLGHRPGAIPPDLSLDSDTGTGG